MSDDAKAYRATDPKDLKESLMSPNVPKSEREHYAVRIIEAADALAKALFIERLRSDTRMSQEVFEALAAYEKARGK